MATTFPTLTGGKPLVPDISDYEHSLRTDPTVKSPTEGGYVISRAKFTRMPRAFRVVYTGITTANKDLILAHAEERKVGSATFTWTDNEGSVRTVRFSSPVKYHTWKQTNYTRWVVEFNVEEI